MTRRSSGPMRLVGSARINAAGAFVSNSGAFLSNSLAGNIHTLTVDTDIKSIAAHDTFIVQGEGTVSQVVSLARVSDTVVDIASFNAAGVAAPGAFTIDWYSVKQG